MKTTLSLALFVLVASIIVAPAFADSKLDSFVNLAIQARTQVKIQLDKMSSVSDDVKALYVQGDSETEQLIAAVKKGDSVEAKSHFLAAMKAFRQVTQAFSETEPVSQKIAPPQQAAPVPEFDYGNALKRFEANENILKSVAAKNNLQVDFTKFDNLLQTAKSNLASGDMATLEKTFVDLKAAGTELQNTIKNMVTEQSNKRAVSFANTYVSKIDAILAQAKELNLSEDQIAKLQNAKQELTSGGDPNQMIIKIKRVYQINLDLLNTKNQKILSEISRLESRLMLLEPKIDSTIQPKFDSAKAILASLKDTTSTDDPIKQLRSLDSLIKEIESYILSLQTQSTNTQTAEQKTPESQTPKETAKQEAFQLSDSPKPQTEELKIESKDKPQEKAEKSERQKGKDAIKSPKQSLEISKLEAKLAELEPQIDETIKPKFDSAKSMLAKLKEGNVDQKKTIRAINSLIDEITQYLDSADSQDN